MFFCTITLIGQGFFVLILFFFFGGGVMKTSSLMYIANTVLLFSTDNSFLYKNNARTFVGKIPTEDTPLYCWFSLSINN